MIKNHRTIITDRVIMAIMNVGYHKEIYVADLAAALSITYSHTTNSIVPKLTDMGIITHEKRRKYRMLTVTPKGLEIYKRLAEIGELLGQPINDTGDRRLDLIVSKESD